MGTAGPLALASEILNDGSGDPFFVLNRSAHYCCTSACLVHTSSVIQDFHSHRLYTVANTLRISSLPKRASFTREHVCYRTILAAMCADVFCCGCAVT